MKESRNTDSRRYRSCQPVLARECGFGLLVLKGRRAETRRWSYEKQEHPLVGSVLYAPPRQPSLTMGACALGI